MTTANGSPPAFSPDNSRLTNLSDGVFAFALTLLVIELKVPDAQVVAHRGLAHAVLEETPAFSIWVLSFFVISTYWLAHHRIFATLHGHDSRLVWLNLLFLLCIAFIWYPTSVLGSYTDEQFAVVFYDGSLIVTSLVATVLWQYAAHRRQLVDPQTVRARHRQERYRAYGTIGVGLFSIAVSFVSVTAAELCWLVLAVQRLSDWPRRFG